MHIRCTFRCVNMRFLALQPLSYGTMVVIAPLLFMLKGWWLLEKRFPPLLRSVHPYGCTLRKGKDAGPWALPGWIRIK